MKFSVLLAGCCLFFSLNTFAQGSINFFGFGDVAADKLCVIEASEDSFIYIKSVYNSVAESEGFISTNCIAISNGRVSTQEIIEACNGVSESLSVGYQSISSIEYSENDMSVADELSSCELN